MGERVSEIQANTATVDDGIEAVRGTIGRMDAVQQHISEVLEEQRRLADALQSE